MTKVDLTLNEQAGGPVPFGSPAFLRLLDALSEAGESQDRDTAATQRHRLDRHWRNIRTISSHHPISYKARAIGRHVIDQTPLPNAAFF